MRVFLGVAVLDVVRVLEPREEEERDINAFLILLRLRVFSLSSGGPSVPLSSTTPSVLGPGFVDGGKGGEGVIIRSGEVEEAKSEL